MTAALARSATSPAALTRARSAAASATSSPTCSAGGGAGGGRGKVAGRGGQPRQARGRDLETEVSLSFDQAVRGAQVPLAVPTSQPCPTCHGAAQARGPSRRSARSATGAASSPRARGSSRSRSRARTATAPGTVIEDPCPTCNGTGAQRSVRRLRVNIPAGVRDGSRIRLARQGRARAARVPSRATCT